MKTRDILTPDQLHSGPFFTNAYYAINRVRKTHHNVPILFIVSRKISDKSVSKYTNQ